MSQRSEAAGSPYAAELAAAKKAVSLAARLCQTVQQEIVQSDVQSKADKSPVTVADYGSQILVSLVLNMEVTSGSFSMVAEEDSADLRKDGAEEILERITDLVNETLAEDASFNILLSQQGILSAIDSGKYEGGPSGRHWILDPIDGTKGFLRGGQYAIALALLDEGKLVLGVLGCPNLPLSSISNLNGSSSGDQVGALFSATIGCGAEEETYPGTVTQIAVLIADLYEEVLTHVSGVSLFLEPWVEPAETVFSKTTLIELSDDVLTSVGGVSLFLELDMDYDAEVLTQVSGLSLFLEQLMDTHHELEGEIDKSTCLDHGVGAVRVIPLVVPLAEGKFQLLLSKEMLHGSTDIATFLLPWDPGAWINFVPGMSGHVVISVFSTGKEGRETSHSVLAELPSWSRSGFSPGFHDQALNTRLLNFLHDKVQVEQFLRYVIEEVHDAERKRFFNTVLYGYFSEVVICLRLQKIASLICAASFIFSVHIFSSLLDPKRSASASYQAFRSNVSHEAFVSASPMAVDCMHVTLGNLLNLLDTCAAAHILPTTYGCLSTPLGKPRQKIVEFISVLLTVGSETVYLKNNLLLDSMGWEDNKAVVLCS